MSEFTKEQLLNIECDWTDPRGEVARFALAQMERAENAEAERDEARRELEDAEEALDELVRKVLVARAEVDKP